MTSHSLWMAGGGVLPVGWLCGAGPGGGEQCLYKNRLPNLRHLALGSNQLGDKRSKQLADSVLSSPVESLDLRQNGIGAEGGLAISQLLTAPRLTHLGRCMASQIVKPRCRHRRGRSAAAAAAAATVDVAHEDATMHSPAHRPQPCAARKESLRAWLERTT